MKDSKRLQGLRANWAFATATVLGAILLIWAVSDLPWPPPLTEYQTLFAGLAAICAALIAYAAALVTIRDAREARNSAEQLHRVETLLVLREGLITIWVATQTELDSLASEGSAYKFQPGLIARMITIPPGLERAVNNLRHLPEPARGRVCAIYDALSDIEAAYGDHPIGFISESDSPRPDALKDWLERIQKVTSDTQDVIEPELDQLLSNNPRYRRDNANLAGPDS